MKKFLTIVFVLVTAYCFGQPTITYPTIGVPTSKAFTRGWAQVDSGFVVGGSFQHFFKVSNSTMPSTNVLKVYSNDSNFVSIGSGLMRIYRSNFADIGFYAHARYPASGMTLKYGFGYDTTGQGQYGGGGHAYIDMRDSVATFVFENGGSVIDWFFTTYYTKAPGDVILGYAGNGKVMVYGVGAPDVTTVGDGSLRKFNVYGTSYFSDTVISNAILKTASLVTGYTSTAVNYPVTATDYTIEVTATGKTITLPTAVGITGRIYTIKLTASGTGTVATTSSQNIDASTTYSLSAQYKYVTVQSNGANWLIIANN